MSLGQFSKWASWAERANLFGLSYPGVYVLAYKNESLCEQPYALCEDIIYFGMTNSVGGLKSRLKQFDNTIIGKTGHGGADRVLFRYPDYSELVPRLFVAVTYAECDVSSNRPEDLRIMGQVAEFEYECLAQFIERFGRLPEFNDKKNAPKHSKSNARLESSNEGAD